MLERDLVPDQTLLQDPKSKFALNLKHRHRKLILQKWIETSVIFCNGVLYIFFNTNSPYPKMAVELYLYNNIEKVENRKHQPLHVFVLTSNKICIPQLKFAAKDLVEMDYCIDKFKEGLITSIQKLSALRMTLAALHTNRNSNKIYADTSEIYIRDDILSNNNNISGTNKNVNRKSQGDSFFEELKEKSKKKEIDNPTFENTGSETKKDSTVKSIPDNISIISYVKISSRPLSNTDSNANSFNNKDDWIYNISNSEMCSKDLVECKLNKNINNDNKNVNSEKLSTFTNNSFIYNGLYHENVDNYIFFGSSKDAYVEISRHFHLGCFMVRQDNDRQILTVQCQKEVVKFNLLSNPSTKMIYISNEFTSFKDLSSLLSYYENNFLPNKNVKLTIPFKLRPR